MKKDSGQSLAKNLKESPETETTEDRNREVIIPAKNVHHLARRGHKARHERHDTQGHGTRHRPRVAVGLAAAHQRRGERQGTLEHELLVARHGPQRRREPAVEKVRRGDADRKRREGAGERLAAAQTDRVPAPEAAKRAGGRVAPAEEQHAHDTDVLGQGVEHSPRAEEVPDDAVVAGVLALAHESAQDAYIQPVDGGEAVAEHVGGGDGDEGGHEVWRDSARLRARRVEPDDEEANRHVQGLARDLVLVHKRLEVPVDGDQAERARAAAQVAPAPAGTGSRLGRREEVAVGLQLLFLAGSGELTVGCW